MTKLKIAKPVLFIGFSSILFQGFSQDPANTIGQVKIASPNAASLGKFVDIPVNYHSGIPSINIPVYTIKSGPLELPISLSYHASGLKVQEQASWVGAGWALNAGGVITRTVKGLPDEKQCNSLQQTYGYFSDYGYLSYLFKTTDGVDVTIYDWQKFVNGRADGEPDLFFFNFNGYSGKFCFNDDRTPVLMPEQDLKIEYNYQGGLWQGLGRSIEGFIITTPDGVKYYFGKIGQIDASAPYSNAYELTSPYSFVSGASTNSRSISSWYLSRIVSADGEFTINLNYTADLYAYYVPNASNPSGNFSGDYNTYDLVKNFVNGVKLSQISFANGKVDFIPGAAREDLCNWTGGTMTMTDVVNQYSPALGSIQISDNNTSGFCKKYAFTYNYFTDNTTPLPAFLSSFSLQTDKKRLRLDYLQETTCNGTLTIPSYQFEYFSELAPRTVCFGMDHWGFINGAINSDLLPSLTNNNAPHITTSVNRESAWPAMRGGTLKKITFPTGGSTTYDYGANTFEVGGINRTVGGLRIQTITQFDGMNTQNNIVTLFDYNNTSGISNSVLYGKPVYVKRVRNDIHHKTNLWLSSPNGCSPTNGCFPTTIPLYSRNSLQPMATTQGYHLGYSEVKVSKTGNGSSVYRYYSLNPWEVDHSCVAVTNYDGNSCSATIPNHPAAPLPNDFIRGELKYEGHFNQAGNAIVEKDYTPVYQDNAVTIPGCIYVMYNSALLGTNYELRTARKVSNTVVERTYGGAGQSQVETSTQTLFESVYHHQPTKTITSNSQAQSIEKRIKYSNDFVVASILNLTNCNYLNYTIAVNAWPANYISALNACGSTEGAARSNCIGDVWSSYLKNISDPRKAYVACRRTNYTDFVNTYQTTHNAAKANANTDLKPVLWMQDVYMNSPVEISEWKNNQLLNATYIKYSNNRDDISGVYVDKSIKVDLTVPSATFTASAVGADNISITKDSRYTDLSTYDFNKGNVISVVDRNGVPGSYDWGYNKNLPIVKINNASNKYKEIGQSGVTTSTFNFQLGPNNPTSGTLQAYFTHAQTGTITVSIPTPPPNAQATATFTLTGPSNQSGYICLSGSGGPSCGGTPSSISYTNMPAGEYILSATVNTTFQSFTFNYSLSYTYNWKVITSSGLKEFFYEGFEENSPLITGTARTGTKYWNTNYTVPFTLPNGRSYIIQWWNLSGGTWNFNQQAYTGSVTLTGPVDDVRIFPSDAQMTTYTYQPLTGITSETNTNGRSIYYEYDEFNRLILIRDHDKNVLKKVCYNYNGQTENCNIFYNTTQSGNFTKVCDPGYTGSSVTYTVPDNRYVSTISLADANSKATADVQANGLAYANTNGTCTQNISCSFSSASGFSVISGNPTHNGTYVAFYIVFYSISGTTNWYGTNTVANVSTSCRPSVNRTFNMSASGRTWEVTVTTSGAFSVRLISGTPPSGTQTIGLTGGSYNL